MTISKSSGESDGKYEYYAQYSVKGDGNPMTVHRASVRAKTSSTAISELRKMHQGREITIRILRIVEPELPKIPPRSGSQWVLIGLSALIALVALAQSIAGKY